MLCPNLFVLFPQRTYAERIRGEARKKWLQQIITAAETGGASIEPVYKAVFQALFKVGTALFMQALYYICQNESGFLAWFSAVWLKFHCPYFAGQLAVICRLSQHACCFVSSWSKIKVIFGRNHR